MNNLLDEQVKVFGLVFAKVASVPKLSLFVKMDDILVFVHATDAVEAAAAKVANERPNLIMSVFDVKFLKQFLQESGIPFWEKAFYILLK